MPEINLLKNEFREIFPGPWSGRGLVSLYIALGLVVLEILVYGFLGFYDQRLKKFTNTYEQDAAGVEFEIGKIQEERLRAISFQSRLKNLETLLDQHLFWSAVFGELEKVTLKQAVYNSLQVDEAEHKFILAGIVPSYTELAKLILGLKTSTYVQDVVLRSSGLAQATESGYAFNLEVTFDPQLLLK